MPVAGVKAAPLACDAPDPPPDPLLPASPPHPAKTAEQRAKATSTATKAAQRPKAMFSRGKFMYG